MAQGGPFLYYGVHHITVARVQHSRVTRDRTERNRTEQNRTEQNSPAVFAGLTWSHLPQLRTFRMTAWTEGDRIRRWKTAVERAVFGLLPVYE